MAVSVEEVAATLRAREAERRARGELRARRLEAHLPALAAALRRHGARDIWLFGSLAQGTTHADSDLDLAVAGLPRAAYFDALAEAMTLICGPVDLVRIEDASASLVARILAEGRAL